MWDPCARYTHNNYTDQLVLIWSRLWYAFYSAADSSGNFGIYDPASVHMCSWRVFIPPREGVTQTCGKPHGRTARGPVAMVRSALTARRTNPTCQRPAIALRLHQERRGEEYHRGSERNIEKSYTDDTRKWVKILWWKNTTHIPSQPSRRHWGEGRRRQTYTRVEFDLTLSTMTSNVTLVRVSPLFSLLRPLN